MENWSSCGATGEAAAGRIGSERAVRVGGLPARRRPPAWCAVQGGLQPGIKGIARPFKVSPVVWQTQSGQQSVKRLGQVFLLGQAEVQRELAPFVGSLQRGDYFAGLDAVSLQQRVERSQDSNAHVVNHASPATLCAIKDIAHLTNMHNRLVVTRNADMAHQGIGSAE